MSKKVCKAGTVILGGEDISSYVTRWSIEANVGDIYMAEIDILDHEDVIEIITDYASHGRTSPRPITAEGGAVVLHRARVATNDRILIRGSDISSWITGYDRQVRIGSLDVIRLYVHCDVNVLSLNGTTPWEESA